MTTVIKWAVHLETAVIDRDNQRTTISFKVLNSSVFVFGTEIGIENREI